MASGLVGNHMGGVQNMTGKVVLITGASTGMGRASAERLAAAGATVVGSALLPVFHAAS